MYVKTRHQLLVHFGYDGARFHGLQPQKDVHTAGAAMRSRLESAAGERARALNFAARTDTGVHAIRNLATCYFVGEIDLQSVQKQLEERRDDGLTNVRSFWVDRHVHARGSARGKRYRYLVDDCTDGTPSSPYSWRIVPTLDAKAMQEAASHFVGTHDFRAFCSNGSTTKNTTKFLASVRIGGPFPLPTGGRRFLIEITGTAFLRKMIRIMVGTMVEIGAKLRRPDDIKRILETEQRRYAGLTAPPQGLTLVEVGCAWPEDGSAEINELSGVL